MSQFVSQNGAPFVVQGNVWLINLPVPPVQYSKDPDFNCSLDNVVIKIYKETVWYTLAGKYTSVNGVSSIQWNSFNWLSSIHQSTWLPNTSFNVRGNANGMIVYMAKTATWFVCLWDVTEYQGNSVNKIFFIKDNGDYDSNSSIFWSGITSSIGITTVNALWVLSDWSIIVTFLVQWGT